MTSSPQKRKRSEDGDGNEDDEAEVSASGFSDEESDNYFHDSDREEQEPRRQSPLTWRELEEKRRQREDQRAREERENAKRHVREEQEKREELHFRFTSSDGSMMLYVDDWTRINSMAVHKEPNVTPPMYRVEISINGKGKTSSLVMKDVTDEAKQEFSAAFNSKAEALKIQQKKDALEATMQDWDRELEKKLR